MKRIMRVAVAAAFGLSVAIAGVGAAQAEPTDVGLTAWKDIYPPYLNGGACGAQEWVPANSYYVHATFLDDNTLSGNCWFELIRRQKDSSGTYGSWSAIGSYGTNPVEMSSNQADWNTGQYYDGPGYQVEACMRETDMAGPSYYYPTNGSWVCTDPI